MRPKLTLRSFLLTEVISPDMFRAVFGIHAFIPFMMTMHSLLPGHLYGAMGYRVFSFLFDWHDVRWERELRDRMFQFAPVYVSAESMRWWLGRECFAKHKCILATRKEKSMEDEEDEGEDVKDTDYQGQDVPSASESDLAAAKRDKQRFSWFGPGTPPFALWVCGADDLVDGQRLLRRFERGREPYVDVVHSKVIEGYEHLDVIWAMDSIEQVGSEVREILWKTAPEAARKVCRTPKGCQDICDFYTRRTEEKVEEERRDLEEKGNESESESSWEKEMRG